MVNDAIIVYPSLKVAADRASGVAQRTFLLLNVAQLTILVVTSFIAGWSPASSLWQRNVDIAVAVIMFGALGIATWLRLGKFDDRWFRCRALSENVKSAVWYFVMCPESLVVGSETNYLKEVELLQSRLEQVSKEVALYDDDGDLVTQWMRDTQKLPLEQKLRLYREHRLQDQQNWYHARARSNTRLEKNWFCAIFLVEFIAVACAAIQAWHHCEMNIVGGVAGMSAAFIAWMQTKRYSDLGVSYSIAASDLRQIAAKRQNATTEDEVQTLVQEVETAVSREHSMWLARRVI